MKVYIVSTYDYEETTIHGIYSTRESAQARIDAAKRKWEVMAEECNASGVSPLELFASRYSEWREARDLSYAHIEEHEVL